MAWIRWRDAADGSRYASVQWRCKDPKCEQCDGRKSRIHSEATGTTDALVAEMWRQDVETRIEGRAPRAVTLDSQEALQRFLTHLRITRAEATVTFYAERLAPVWAAWAATPLARWSRPMFEAFIARQEGWSPRTVQATRNACKRFITWAQKSNVGVPDFVGDFKGKAIHQDEPEALSVPERDQLLATARVGRRVKGGRKAPHALEPAIALAALAGLRFRELSELDSADVDWEGGTILVRATKGHRDRRVHMGPKLREVLQLHRRISGPVVRAGGVRNYSSARRSLELLCSKAGVPFVGFHGLRHTYGTQLAALGTDVPTIGAMMGHKPGSTVTLRYLHTDPERMRQAAERLG